jgi:hypothetical protein
MIRKLQFIILLLGSYSICSGQESRVNLSRSEEAKELVGRLKEFAKKLDIEKKTENCITPQDQEARTLAEFFELAKNDPRLAAALIGESLYEAITSHPKTTAALATFIILLKIRSILNNVVNMPTRGLDLGCIE